MKKEKLIEPWVIYMWNTGNVVWGAAPVVTKDGLKEIYRSTCEYKYQDTKEQFRAEVQVKKQLQNVMNAINWYGKKILDKNGNIDLEKFKEAEVAAAVTSSGIHVDIEKVKPIKTFKVKKIKEYQAIDYNFY